MSTLTRRLALGSALGFIGLGVAEAARAAAGTPPLEAPEPVTVAEAILLIGIALLAAKLLGTLATRWGQPSVLGELTAGILLGPSVAGRLVGLQIDPLDPILHVIAQVGIVLLLFEVGLETDVSALLRAGPSAVLVALIGVAVPFGLGFAVVQGAVAAGWMDADPETRTLLAIFVGATLTATSIGITARVLQDLGLMESLEARILIGAAVVDDVLGLVLLSLVAALGAESLQGAQAAGVTGWSVARPLLLAVAFLGTTIVVGRRVAPWLLDRVAAIPGRGLLVATTVGLALLLAAGSHAIGSAFVIGGFAAGAALSSGPRRHEVQSALAPLVDMLAPLFFVLVGASVDVSLLDVTDPAARRVLLVAALLAVVALAGKLLAGVGVVQRGARRLVVGVGMIPRGEVGLIFVQAGAVIMVNGASDPRPLLGREVVTALTLVIMLTTFLAPPALRAVTGRIRS